MTKKRRPSDDRAKKRHGGKSPATSKVYLYAFRDSETREQTVDLKRIGADILDEPVPDRLKKLVRRD